MFSSKIWSTNSVKYLYFSFRLCLIAGLNYSFFKATTMPNDRLIEVHSSGSSSISLASFFIFVLSFDLIDIIENSGGCWIHFQLMFCRHQTFQLSWDWVLHGVICNANFVWLVQWDLFFRPLCCKINQLWSILLHLNFICINDFILLITNLKIMKNSIIIHYQSC